MEQNTTNKPLRRVGTLTLGVCLIAAGTLFLLARFLPGLPWLVIWQVLPAAGLILLGCEVLYYSARPGACRCDFGSVVLCLLMMGGCFGVSKKEQGHCPLCRVVHHHTQRDCLGRQPHRLRPDRKSVV